VSGEIKIRNGSDAWQTIDPRLSRDLRPSIGGPPPISGPLLDRLRCRLYFDRDPLTQIWNKNGRLVDEALRKLFFNFPIPARTEVIRGLTTQAECAFPLRRMGGVHF